MTDPHDEVQRLLRGLHGPRADAPHRRSKTVLAVTAIGGLLVMTAVLVGGYRLGQVTGVLPSDSQAAPSADASVQGFAPVAPNRQHPGASAARHAVIKNPVPASSHDGPSLVVPALDIDAEAVPMSFVDGDLQEPESVHVVAYLSGPGPRVDDVLGTILVGGHVSDDSDNPGVFWNLDTVEPGALVRYTDDTGETRQFRITNVVTYPKTGFPWDQVLDMGTPLRLALMTCTDRVELGGGGFHYASIAVAYAEPVD